MNTHSWGVSNKVTLGKHTEVESKKNKMTDFNPTLSVVVFFLLKNGNSLKALFRAGWMIATEIHIFVWLLLKCRFSSHLEDFLPVCLSAGILHMNMITA